jgi:putative transposase
VHGYFKRWEYDGTLHNIHHSLYQECRAQVERPASPTACIIDSQSAKGADLDREERTKGVGPH